MRMRNVFDRWTRFNSNRQIGGDQWRLYAMRKPNFSYELKNLFLVYYYGLKGYY